MPFHDVDWDGWSRLLERVHEPEHNVEVALVGKYIDLPDAYLSVTEALRAGGFANDAKVGIRWVAADDCQTPEGAQASLEGVDAVLVPGGFGVRGIDGKVGALRWARENLVPTLGICLGLQSMVIEYARNVLGWDDASSTEFHPTSSHPVVATMAEQKAIVEGEGDMGGTMRLGAYQAQLTPGSVVAKAYGGERVSERHRHRYEVNNAYRAELEEAGLLISGTSPDSSLVEFVELRADMHPYYVSTQAHPEFKSRPTRAHPLFAGLIAAALEKQSS
jgi:CTP synthase